MRTVRFNPIGLEQKGVGRFNVDLCTSTYTFYNDFAIFAEKVVTWRISMSKIDAGRHKKCEVCGYAVCPRMTAFVFIFKKSFFFFN